MIAARHNSDEWHRRCLRRCDGDDEFRGRIAQPLTKGLDGALAGHVQLGPRAENGDRSAFHEDPRANSLRRQSYV